ncbi:MAG TPA: HTTM domain-containing protein [Pirellulaceae bacterium]|nr:HTTM domain-containing protein [Pirellulaceae bacterium]
MIAAAMRAVRGWCDEAWETWDRFWFTPTDPATLGLIRVLAGAMILYTHLVWTIGLERFLSRDGMLSPEFVRRFQETDWAWSHLNYIPPGLPLLIAHLAALAIMGAFCAGWQTRITGLLTAALVVSYANRAPAALFGLDQINGFLALYLAIGPSGAAWSIDRWLARRRTAPGPKRGGGSPAGEASTGAAPSIGANVSIRLIQLHMCLIYLFAAVGKLQGESWWNGEAFWGAVANREYQTMDLTWLAGYPMLVAALTHITIFWELSYSALVWFRLTRPFIVAISIPLHLGIAFGMGMITFGTIMIVGNLAFVPPATIRRVISVAVRRS